MMTKNATGAELTVAERNWKKMDALVKAIAVARVALDGMAESNDAAACARLFDSARETVLGLFAEAWGKEAAHA